MTQILAVYIILINIVTFWVFGHDKRQARNKGWRVPEKTLFLLAAAGGRDVYKRQSPSLPNMTLRKKNSNASWRRRERNPGYTTS